MTEPSSIRNVTIRTVRPDWSISMVGAPGAIEPAYTPHYIRRIRMPDGTIQEYPSERRPPAS